jgi:hypothetical protein
MYIKCGFTRQVQRSGDLPRLESCSIANSLATCIPHSRHCSNTGQGVQCLQPASVVFHALYHAHGRVHPHMCTLSQSVCRSHTPLVLRSTCNRTSYKMICLRWQCDVVKSVAQQHSMHQPRHSLTSTLHLCNHHCIHCIAAAWHPIPPLGLFSQSIARPHGLTHAATCASQGWAGNTKRTSN